MWHSLVQRHWRRLLVRVQLFLFLEQPEPQQQRQRQQQRSLLYSNTHTHTLTDSELWSQKIQHSTWNIIDVNLYCQNHTPSNFFFFYRKWHHRCMKGQISLFNISYILWLNIDLSKLMFNLCVYICIWQICYIYSFLLRINWIKLWALPQAPS